MQRLDEYLTRMAGETLDTDAQAAPITLTQATGCTGLDVSGPSWGVVPQAERVITAGANTGKYVDDLGAWLLNDWFSQGVGRDGVQVTVRWHRDEPQLTITATGPCSWPADRDGGPPGGRLPPLPPPEGPTAVAFPGDSALCTSPKRKVLDPDAPAFAGPGPHPVAMLTYAEEKDFNHGQVSIAADWAPLTGTPKHANAQLAVCVRVQPTTDTGTDVACDYKDPADPAGYGTPFEFDLFETTYHVTVRQARDGALVEAFTLPGTRGGESQCPSQFLGYHRKLALGLDFAVLKDKLRPLAESPR
ncbi:hypothetical protein L3Q67_24915 [Saccharothrix sp. AJ9571]|nr:hypothetical protein L3Q67_24915 [Saccharothrix sp. AJ9571]